ncbi:MAG TPA: hypothetical protein VKX16_09530, partial [Chloroflexota bacterium]|nr:hypothetical protein [Chloroflexota bacterium]
MTLGRRWVVLLPILAVILLAWLGHGQAQSQTVGTATPTPVAETPTPTTTPTPTATASIPSARDLLTQMSLAITAKNSFHQSSRTSIVIPQTTKELETVQGDVSLRPLLQHIVGTIRTTRLTLHPAKTTTQHEEIVVVKKKAASKFGKKAWTCTTLAKVTQTVGGLLGGASIQSLDNLGAEVVRAIPVWHVRAVVTVKLSGSTLPITDDLYIAQADSTLVRETASASASFFGVTFDEKVTQDNSRYGETVKVKLPTACQGKH